MAYQKPTPSYITSGIWLRKNLCNPRHLWIQTTTPTVSTYLAHSKAQGNLTPPGAPAPTMKTLDQVEPRIPISSTPYTISNSGSYYLTENSTGRITIEANDVTLDLMGFRIWASSGDAISITTGYGTNTIIRNGTLRPGSSSVALDGRYADYCLFENLRIDGNNASYGIRAGDRCTVRDCYVRNCYNCGISVGNYTEVRNCRVVNGPLDGIHAGAGCRIVGNTVENNGDDGLYITGSKTYVAENIVKGNGDNYDFAAGNQLNLLICEIPEVLNWPCSVKLAGTLVCAQTGVNGITVAANDVTIDMDGHTLVGPGSLSGSGIYQPDNYRNLHIFNGKTVNWEGLGNAGIYPNGKSAILTDLQVSTNYYGIYAYSDCTLSGCTAYNNSDDGIYAGEGSTLSGCTAYNNGDDGIYAYSGCTLSDCTAYNNSDDGISTYSGCTLSDCTAKKNIGDGIQVSYYCKVTGCTCDGNGYGGDGAGIHVTSYDNRIDGNNVTYNDRGIDVDTAGNFIVRNSASGNTTDYDISGPQTIGPIITATGTITNTNPWANFSF